MRQFLVAVLLSALLAPTTSRADIFGGDVAVLVQILANAVQQLAQLENLLHNGQDSLQLMRDINRGINDSMQMVKTIYPNLDPGVYRDWTSANDALQKLQQIYGIIGNSPNRQIFQDTDQGVAEAVALNNSVYQYTQQIDELGEAIKASSHDVSPGGAQKLTAQTLGVMLHVMNQSLRTQATGLKLQAQALVVQNKKEKDGTSQYLQNADVLTTAMKSDNSQFKAPRF